MRVRTVSVLSTLGWPAWLATLVATGVLTSTIVFWATRLWAPRPVTAPAVAVVDPDATGRPGPAARLFGNPDAATAPDASGNIDVVGVLSAGPRGSAILAVDGQPPKFFAVGDPIGGGAVLAVEPDRVVIGSSARRTALPAPARPDPAILTDGARPDSDAARN